MGAARALRYSRGRFPLLPHRARPLSASEIPAPGGRGADNFDLLRLLVSMLVLARHGLYRLHIDTPGWWHFFDFFPGVPIFFVVSGFLVSASFERNPDLLRYAGNRARRLFPGLWVCVALTILAATYFGFDFLHPAGLLWAATQLVGLIYTPDFLDAFGSGTYNGALWTIPVSLQFYVALPLIYLLLRKARSFDRGLLLLWLAALALALVFRPRIAAVEGGAEPLDLKLLRYSLVPHLYLFLMGMLLRRFRVHESPLLRGKALYWLAGYVTLMFLVPDSPVKLVFLPVLLSFVMLSVAFSAGGLTRGALRRHDISYGVFIYHGLVINVFVELGLTGSGLHLLAVALVTVVLALFSWHFIESPFLGRRTRVQSAVPAPRAPAAGGAAPHFDRTPSITREKNVR
jgi:peptidoglycan/LPS O-acetylase OafA/YrhL